MRETARARAAFNDYVELGPNRSLENLLKVYHDRSNAPTHHIATLKDWSRLFSWQDRLLQIEIEEQAAIVARGIVAKQNRLDAYNERWQELREARKAWAQEYQGAPGGARSGYYARQVKFVKVHAEYQDDDKGKPQLVPLGPSEEVEEWALDTGLLNELRSLEKQAAVEIGDWQEKRLDEHKGDVGLNYGLDDDAAQRLADLIAKGITASAQTSSGT